MPRDAAQMERDEARQHGAHHLVRVRVRGVLAEPSHGAGDGQHHEQRVEGPVRRARQPAQERRLSLRRRRRATLDPLRQPDQRQREDRETREDVQPDRSRDLGRFPVRAPSVSGFKCDG